MKSILIRFGIMIVVCFLFFGVLPLFNKETQQTKEEHKLYPLYKIEEPKQIEDFNHIHLMGITMEFPFSMADLPEVFHIKDMYYDDMVDGIEAGDYFHCELLNEDNEPVAYLRVSNLKKNIAKSPDGMTVTYMEVSTFEVDGETYGVPFSIYKGVGIGSKGEEVKSVFPEITVSKKGYSIATTTMGIHSITMEFFDNELYKMSIKSYDN